MHSNLTILIDMDDVIKDLLNPWLKILNERFSMNVTFDMITDWNISKFFPGIPIEDILGILKEPTFWDNVKPKKDAVFYIRKFVDEGFNVKVCSASHYDTVKFKFEKALFPYFPFLSWKDVIIAYDKHMIRGDYLIDDKPQNLLNGEYKGILFDMPHNKDFIDSKVRRCYSWKECYEAIHEEIILKKKESIDYEY